MMITVDQQIKEQNQKIQQLQEEIAELRKWQIQIRKKIDSKNPLNQAPNRKCYTIDDVIEITGYDKKTIKKYEKQGKLRVAYPNSKKRYLPTDVNFFLEGYC